MKTQHSIKLTGHVNRKPANTLQAGDQSLVFIGHSDETPGYFKIYDVPVGSPVLCTPKGEYPLKWNDAGYWEPAEPMNIKIHVTLKKISGKLIYWA